jgi:hypothetical protein
MSVTLMVSPVFATFSAAIRIVDEEKKATLARLLAENVMSSVPGERLDEKLASLALPTTADDDCEHVECMYQLIADATAASASSEFRGLRVVGHSRLADLKLEFRSKLNQPTEHPDGVISVSPSPSPPPRSTNPFDSPQATPLSSSPSPSEEMNYKAAQQATSLQPSVGRKLPPLAPPRRIGEANGT